jgi:CRP/FNR family transcriptional regulator, cyclic AMP receptor protein
MSVIDVEAQTPVPVPAVRLREFLGVCAWTRTLTAEQQRRIETETSVRRIPRGGYICRKGERVDYWMGVIEGLGKMTNTSAAGKVTTFTGVATGSWFGEGSLFKDEPRRYDVIALRDSEVAYMPRATFMWLLDASIDFNRFLLMQLNERLGFFIGMVEYDRLLGPDSRVAHCLAALFNPTLAPGIRPLIKISQEEIGHLAGLSRQRVNHSLKVLEAAGLVRLEYGGITVLDLAGLKTFGE